MLGLIVVVVYTNLIVVVVYTHLMVVVVYTNLSVFLGSIQAGVASPGPREQSLHPDTRGV